MCVSAECSFIAYSVCCSVASCAEPQVAALDELEYGSKLYHHQGEDHSCAVVVGRSGEARLVAVAVAVA